MYTHTYFWKCGYCNITICCLFLAELKAYFWVHALFTVYRVCSSAFKSQREDLAETSFKKKIYIFICSWSCGLDPCRISRWNYSILKKKDTSIQVYSAQYIFILQIIALKIFRKYHILMVQCLQYHNVNIYMYLNVQQLSKFLLFCYSSFIVIHTQ